jgi:hypothetical protein
METNEQYINQVKDKNTTIEKLKTEIESLQEMNDKITNLKESELSALRTEKDSEI